MTIEFALGWQASLKPLSMRYLCLPEHPSLDEFSRSLPSLPEEKVDLMPSLTERPPEVYPLAEKRPKVRLKRPQSSPTKSAKSSPTKSKSTRPVTNALLEPLIPWIASPEMLNPSFLGEGDHTGSSHPVDLISRFSQMLHHMGPPEPTSEKLHVWARTRPELCESLPYFRSFQGGIHLDARSKLMGYLL